MSEWPIVRLGDYCQKIGSGATPRGGSKVYLDSGKTYLIRSQNVYNDGFKAGGLVCIDEDAAQKLKNVIVKQDDVLLNITGDSVARACLVDPSFMPARVNQHVAIIRPDREEFDARFIRYFLVRPDTQNMLLAMAGVGGTRNALTKGMIEGLEIPKPKIEEQQSIADALSCLDAKIDLNRQTNQTLEQIAQAIFKSWFVDFEPVKAKQHIRSIKGNDEQTERAAQAVIAGAVNLDVITTATDLSALDRRLIQALGEKLAHQTEAQREQLATTASHFPDQLVESELGLIAAGWKWQQLSLLSEKISKGTTPRRTDIVNAEDPRTVAFLKVRDISDDGEISRRGLELVPASVHLGPLKRSVLETEDLLFSIAGTIGRVAVLESDLAGSNTNQAVAFIRLKDKDNLLNLCRLNLVSDRIQKDAMSRVVQGVQANLSLTSLGEMMILLPSNETLEDLNAVISPITESKKLLITQIRSLAMIRDTLLPKLLSGELAFADQIPAKEVINV